MIYPRPNFTIDPTTLPPSVQLADTPLLEVSSTLSDRHWQKDEIYDISMTSGSI